MDIGQKIYNLRTQQGLTLEELGQKVGVGKSTVRKWENGIIENMKQNNLAKLANALGTTPAFLMGLTEETEKESYKQGKTEAALIKKYSQLSSANQLAVLTLIDNLLSAQEK